MAKMKKWANKSRGLRLYGEGIDLYGRKFRVQDGSWAEFHGIRIYGYDSTTEDIVICLSLKMDGVNKLIKALKTIKSLTPSQEAEGEEDERNS